MPIQLKHITEEMDDITAIEFCGFMRLIIGRESERITIKMGVYKFICSDLNLGQIQEIKAWGKRHGGNYGRSII